MVQSRPRTNREKVAATRAKLRAQGLRPIQIWVPDVRSANFTTEARKQSRRVANAKRARADQSFAEAVADWDEA